MHADFKNDKSSEKILDKFAAENSNVKYIKLENDPGLYSAWNIAIQNSHTEFITNWNVDDRKSNFGLEVLYKEIIKDRSIDLVYGYTYVSTKPNEKYIENSYEIIYPCLPHSFQNLLINNSPHCMPMWRKDLHERFGLFDNNYKTAADGDMWLKACAGGAKMKMINHPIGLYYHNPEGRSTKEETIKEMIKEVQEMREKYKKYL